MDGHYQVHYLPFFAVDKNKLVQITLPIRILVLTLVFIFQILMVILTKDSFARMSQIARLSRKCTKMQKVNFYLRAKQLMIRGEAQAKSREKKFTAPPDH